MGLRKLRKEKGLTQGDLAKMIHVDQTAISQWERGVSQAKAAPLMGISQTALSQYRRSMYDNGDISALESKLEEFFKAQDEQDASTEKALPYKPIQDYIPTSISEDVYKLIRYCQLEKGMVIIHGDAGIGKTKGAEKFVRDNPTSSVYIQATPSIGTMGNLLKMLARALRVPESRSKLELALSIREKLEGTNRVIIIDEAQHLQLRALEEIRTWTDPNPITGQQGVGIALIGNTETYTRMVGKQEARFAQLFSRIRMNRFYSTHLRGFGLRPVGAAGIHTKPAAKDRGKSHP